jgi:DNA-directed RNA polymerase beta subunit
MCGRGPWSVSARHGSWQTTAGVSLVQSERRGLGTRGGRWRLAGPSRVKDPALMRRQRWHASLARTSRRFRRSSTSRTSSTSRRSYEKFLQIHVARTSAKTSVCRGFQERLPDQGLQQDRALEFVSYHLEKPKYDVDECRARGMTYAAPVKVTIRLVVWDKDETGNKSIRDVKEQEVYFGEIPLMTDNGTFIINGTERVIVSQLHRSPRRVLRPRQGQDPLVGQAALQRPRHPLPRLVARLRVRPQGPALRPHRPPPQDAATVLLRALGYTTEELLQLLLQHRGHPPRPRTA